MGVIWDGEEDLFAVYHGDERLLLDPYAAAELMRALDLALSHRSEHFDTKNMRG